MERPASKPSVRECCCDSRAGVTTKFYGKCHVYFPHTGKTLYYNLPGCEDRGSAEKLAMDLELQESGRLIEHDGAFIDGAMVVCKNMKYKSTNS